MYSYSYLNSAKSIIEMYNGEVPLAIHLKSYFKMNKKFGSRDRKYIMQLCYSYFRTGKLFKNEPIEDKISKSLFLCSTEPNKLLEGINDEYNKYINYSLEQKLLFLNVNDVKNIFPLNEELSLLLNKDLFIEKQLKQPFLFIRIRPKYLADVLIKLKKIDIVYKIIDPYTIQLPNGFKVEEHFLTDKEVVIQDYASQMVLKQLLNELIPKQFYKVWDCCAASGGKSILINDLYNGKIDLFVTDIRKSILENLEKRFFTARVLNYKIAEVNLFKKQLSTNDLFDIIICDAPCSGSGTWGRTPEQSYYFRNKKLYEYIEMQKNITNNALQSLKLNGYFLYITCSAFAKENENIVTYLLQKNSYLELINQNYISGLEYNSDTMFVALLKKCR